MHLNVRESQCCKQLIWLYVYLELKEFGLGVSPSSAKLLVGVCITSVLSCICAFTINQAESSCDLIKFGFGLLLVSRFCQCGGSPSAILQACDSGGNHDQLLAIASQVLIVTPSRRNILVINSWLCCIVKP